MAAAAAKMSIRRMPTRQAHLLRLPALDTRSLAGHTAFAAGWEYGRNNG
jgi:hypothetical protein